MQRITPTGWANQKGRQVRQLGTLEAVLAALPDRSVLIVGGRWPDREAALDTLERVGRAGSGITVISATAGPARLYEIDPETKIGVAPDAFAGVSTDMWRDVQALLARRFREVIWG